MDNHRVLSVGEILLDVFSAETRIAETRIGGAPFNFFFHLHHLHLRADLLTRVGDDREGREILDFLKAHRLSSELVQRDPHHPTGRVEISLDGDGHHDFHICEPAAYFSIHPPSAFSQKTPYSLLYFGTLAQWGKRTRATIAALLTHRDKATKAFVDLNLRRPFYNRELVEHSLYLADILKLNEEELGEVMRLIPGLPREEAACLNALSDLYHLDTIVLTRGSRGSTFFKKGKAVNFDIVPQNDHSGDAVGAGDAFSAVVVLGLLKRWPPQVILERASAVALKICGIRGAIPSDPGFYDAFRYFG